MAIILLGIVLVAALNIISTLLMVVLVKRRDIGSLMAQGAAPADILGIFLGEGLLIGGLGTAVGTALGLFACGALARFPLPIPADVYFISHIPVQVEARDVLLVILISVVLCALAAIYPAWYAARIPPAEAVREV
jgi:lipoprotein-releasing system permease protein